jgi:hypothetical protein
MMGQLEVKSPLKWVPSSTNVIGPVLGDPVEVESAMENLQLCSRRRLALGCKTAESATLALAGRVS